MITLYLALAGKDELFGQFFGALEKIHYFIRMPDGNDDQVQLDRATFLFHNAVQVYIASLYVNIIFTFGDLPALCNFYFLLI